MTEKKISLMINDVKNIVIYFGILFNKINLESENFED